ncbi:MAG: bifunctional D-glycero-beta-D-manno-heptose-7-phosphate kinase/D-glycero-beta-D-manno-heptose 1-phosphate adenylyltransferase HldE [Gammaproteobacteria bacterium]|nr:bifunctional D-glycero-beta-D-manno-heptose-7-phosphate kinase/D-glycero-beta-D-manno-heptose 1-phosphate adenylyltransferase HldE [Gammaproteobacteria bacterium]
MKNQLPPFADTHILVIGDVMLDRYWAGATSRVSPEAPVPVVQIQHLEERAGGAANVALNVAALGGRVSLLGVVGRDEAATKLETLLTKTGIDCKWIQLDDCTTITKLRVLSRHQQLIRLDFEDGSLINGAEAIVEAAIPLLKNVDLVILSDYDKGSLYHAKKIIAAIKKQNKSVPVIVDPKGSQFDKYYGATLLTPNQAEFEAIAGAFNSNHELERNGLRLCEQLGLNALLITRSDKGMLLLQKDTCPHYLAARARDVFDVTGAGDTVIAVLAAGLAAGESFESAANLANLAAGLVVAKLGAQSVTPQELLSEIQSTAKRRAGVLTRAVLLEQVRGCRLQSEKIVFTNGCFDLLHAGHVRYLEEAASLGDRLIVAVNDDDSVRKLKGEGRPVNVTAARMSVLAALRCVDWVVSFSEDTPANLIADIMPDVLVKGGDYKAAEIAGYQVVTEKGGEVKVLAFHEGYSTTDIIARISG